MTSPNTISVDKLSRLIGLPKCPHLIDVRTEEDFAAAPHLIPGSLRRPFAAVETWGADLAGRAVVVVCGGQVAAVAEGMDQDVPALCGWVQ